MTEPTLTQGILTFCNQLAAGRAGEDGASIAQSRRWLDEHGCATDEGRALVQALVAQRATRSAYRNVL
jgi:hypothetical protein